MLNQNIDIVFTKYNKFLNTFEEYNNEYTKYIKDLNIIKNELYTNFLNYLKNILNNKHVINNNELDVSKQYNDISNIKKGLIVLLNKYKIFNKNIYLLNNFINYIKTKKIFKSSIDKTKRLTNNISEGTKTLINNINKQIKNINFIINNELIKNSIKDIWIKYLNNYKNQLNLTSKNKSIKNIKDKQLEINTLIHLLEKIPNIINIKSDKNIMNKIYQLKQKIKILDNKNYVETLVLTKQLINNHIKSINNYILTLKKINIKINSVKNIKLILNKPIKINSVNVQNSSVIFKQNKQNVENTSLKKSSSEPSTNINYKGKIVEYINSKGKIKQSPVINVSSNKKTLTVKKGLTKIKKGSKLRSNEINKINVTKIIRII